MSKSILVKLFICIIVVFILSNSICLSTSHCSSLSNIFAEGKEFLIVGNNIEETIDTQELKKTSDFIYNALFGIAVVVAIIVAMALGIQFMVASADEKAKVKEALIPFVVGCVVVFGSFTIWKLAVKIGNNAENSVVTFTHPDIGDGDRTDQYWKCGNCGGEFMSALRPTKCPECGIE